MHTPPKTSGASSESTSHLSLGLAGSGILRSPPADCLSPAFDASAASQAADSSTTSNAHLSFSSRPTCAAAAAATMNLSAFSPLHLQRVQAGSMNHHHYANFLAVANSGGGTPTTTTTTNQPSPFLAAFPVHGGEQQPQQLDEGSFVSARELTEGATAGHLLHTQTMASPNRELQSLHLQ